MLLYDLIGVFKMIPYEAETDVLFILFNYYLNIYDLNRF